MRSLPARLAGLCLLAVLGCSLVVDSSDLDSHACGQNERMCGTRCVPDDLPEFGCRESTSCAPCDGTHGVATCVDGKCVPKCLEGFGCTNCSVNIYTDKDNCGKCPNKCPGNQICSVGECIDPPVGG